MELVYLWVEDYKNIKEQGFNFSPQFECEYDGKILTITPTPKKAIDNFFGDNINVTAIVGENGSGKSSIVKLIFMLIFFKKFKKDSDFSHICQYIKNDWKDKTIFLVFKDNDNNFSQIYIHNQIKCNIECNSLDNIEFFSVYFNYILDTWYDKVSDAWVNKTYHKSDGYSIPLLYQPDKQNSNTRSATINMDNIIDLNQQNILKFYGEINNTISITNFFEPNRLKIKDTSYTFSSSESNVTFYKIFKILKHFHKIIENLKIYNELINVVNSLVELEDTENFKYINKLYISSKILLSGKELFNKKIYKNIEKNFKKMFKKDILIIEEELIADCDFNNLINKNVSEYKVLKIKKSISFDEEKTYETDSFKELYSSKYLYLNNKNVKTILDNIPPWLDIEFYENNKSLSNLSSGEKALFTIISNIMYHTKNILDDDNYQSINIFLDETELGIHPNWQKKYLTNIIESINLLENPKNKNIYIFCITHSPFILSDLPKANVIFLDTFDKKETEKKYSKLDIKDLKDGNCINVSEHIDINPFGANIHTLLSDGFFMEDGLMGEFAKGKINEIIAFFNNEKTIEEISTKREQLKQVIESIGEDLLRMKLLDMYYEKFENDELEKERQQLLEQKKHITEQIKSIEDRQK